MTKLGRYDILKTIGKGSMGLVYEAHDPTLNRKVAIKTIRVDQMSTDAAAEFEARILLAYSVCVRLHHTNIIGVFEAGRDEGIGYIVMDLVQGGNLRQLLDVEGRLTFGRALDIMLGLLSALEFIHGNGIVHRDIKPASVMFDSDGHVKLGNFDVACLIDRSDAADSQGEMVGTLRYMSPEQVIGAKVDARTDLFAAGVVLYQLLTGEKPFDGDSDFAIMQAIMQKDPPPPSSIESRLPAGIEAVVAKALAKNRVQRYASARDFAVDLRMFA